MKRKFKIIKQKEREIKNKINKIKNKIKMKGIKVIVKELKLVYNQEYNFMIIDFGFEFFSILIWIKNTVQRKRKKY